MLKKHMNLDVNVFHINSATHGFTVSVKIMTQATNDPLNHSNQAESPAQKESE